MTREEAIKVIKDGLEDMSLDFTDEEQYEALTMAITALEQEPSGDLISRQAVIDWCGDINMDVYTNEVKEFVIQLPSVKQEPKTGALDKEQYTE